ncbi:MAG: CotH kinase family protein [Bacteroidales bacterium]|nr:CotH kinase family protein [Bacteroidales bacterium]
MTARQHIQLLVLCATALIGDAAHAQVTFSAPGGFYPHAFTLELTAAEGLAIHYTTDGSSPTPASPLYQHPLELSPSLYSSRDIFLMPDAPDDLWNPPKEVRHAIVLRAAAFDKQGEQAGPTATRTYLVADLLGREPQLPVLSIALDHEMLFDPDSGIFSPNRWDPENEYYSGNFNQHGREWERLAHVEFYELDNTGFAQPLGLRVHGTKTRRYMQKPLKLYARKEYGEKKIQCPLYDEVGYTSFKRLVLKPFRAAWTGAGLQDLLAHQLARPLRCASLASRPVTLFLNGEYWGIYFLQEAPDERLIEQRDDVDADDVNLIGAWDGIVENGNSDDFLNLMQWLETADLADTLQYQRLCSLIDIDDFIDYQLFEAFITNTDWPANNMRCYQHHSKPWRWIFFDGDAGFGSPDLDMTERMVYQGDDTWPSSRQATLCFRRLLQSPDFVERFGRRMYQLAATFDYSRTSPLLEKDQEAIAPEIEWQSQRFNRPASVAQWKKAVGKMDRFLKRRPYHFVMQMEQLLALPASGDSAPRVYPNPARDYVDVEIPGHQTGWLRCSLYDLMGRQVMSRPLFVPVAQRTIRIPLAALPAGQYLLRLSNSDTPIALTIY